MFLTDKKFELVEQTRALSELGLFGNAGGYIGVFLGCALIQIPDFVQFFYHRMK